MDISFKKESSNNLENKKQHNSFLQLTYRLRSKSFLHNHNKSSPHKLEKFTCEKLNSTLIYSVTSSNEPFITHIFSETIFDSYVITDDNQKQFLEFFTEHFETISKNLAHKFTKFKQETQTINTVSQIFGISKKHSIAKLSQIDCFSHQNNLNNFENIKLFFIEWRRVKPLLILMYLKKNGTNYWRTSLNPTKLPTLTSTCSLMTKYSRLWFRNWMMKEEESYGGQLLTPPMNPSRTQYTWKQFGELLMALQMKPRWKYTKENSSKVTVWNLLCSPTRDYLTPNF